MKKLIALYLFFFSTTVNADVAVLIHGYLGSAGSWEQSGVTASLMQNGWQRAGLITPGGLLPAPAGRKGNRFYTVDLPSMAPVAIQADLLRRMLALIEQRHGDEPVILVGHSAGGVVARMALVQGGVRNPKALITIATPHLGTLRAVEALEETDDPFPISVVKEFFAGDLYGVVRDSWEVLLDLTPEQPGSLLFWLNRQPHPEITYVSVVRPGPIGAGDELVPAFSQDMNNVNTLKGRSEVVTTPLSHRLHPSDGRLLSKLLSSQ
ncbi:MAG: alpha/beta hydrolase [Candidatus Thiodiazotropha sp. (ex Monitilora ramsayi)]|nr:alpha/beta hydrolase [Candidatus Thiodiazotropha sp. (ex Monitilora ramsayi)]